jgi:nucleotidyltransferase/DNA polymerase involved in DNA repair
MVDSAIKWLFVDLNSYFASIEQELCPELRGQPIAIVPIRVEAQTGCCIAVSYQAKAYGVKTGYGVADAKLPAALDYSYSHTHDREEHNCGTDIKGCQETSRRIRIHP